MFNIISGRLASYLYHSGLGKFYIVFKLTRAESLFDLSWSHFFVVFYILDFFFRNNGPISIKLGSIYPYISVKMVKEFKIFQMKDLRRADKMR